MDNDTVAPLVWALAQGGCPRLKQLSMPMGREAEAIYMLSRMLDFGRLRCLRAVDMSISADALNSGLKPHRVHRVKTILQESLYASLESLTINGVSRQG